MNAKVPHYHPTNGKLSNVKPIPLADFLTMLERANSGIVQNPTIILSDRLHSNPIMGEKRAGTVVDIRSGVVYDVMVMPGELENVTWAEAKASITAAGGDLPTPVEMLLLNGLLGRVAFQDSYWVDEKVKFDGDAEDSISYFSDGIFDFSDANDRMSARGVRRVCIGDAADENLVEVDDNTVIVPAPAQPSGISGESTVKLPDQLWQAVHAACAILESENVPAHFEAAGALRTSMSDFEEVIAIPTPGSGPDLSDRPDLQAMRAALFEKVEPVTLEAIATVLDELNGIMDADDEGDTIQTLAPVIKVINGLMLIADVEKLTGGAIKPDNATVGATLGTPTSGLQQLREQLDPDLQRMYPDLLTTEGVKPTRDDVLDVMVKLQAMIPAVGPAAPEFGMEVISGLVAMIDVERLA